MPELHGGPARASVTPMRRVDRPKTFSPAHLALEQMVDEMRATEEQMLADALEDLAFLKR